MAERVHRYASLEHYAEHIAPIWDALPAEARGESWAPRAGRWWGSPVPARADCRAPGPVIVAGYADAQKMGGRRLIYVEHGAGQTYAGAAGNGSYSGGAGLDRAGLFLCPSERVAQRWRDRYPTAVAVAVGVPKLDRWHERTPRLHDWIVPGPVVAVTWHWQCQLIPETMSALGHYQRALAGLRDAVAAAGGELWGHGHPRAWGALERLWRALGVRCVPAFADVLDRADLLVGDNSSALPEFASTGRPVCWLSAPWYRRSVEHGGRFWEWPGGQVHVQEPADLVPGVFRALTDPPEVRAARAEMVASVYVATDGHASARAAAAIIGPWPRQLHASSTSRPQSLTPSRPATPPPG